MIVYIRSSLVGQFLNKTNLFYQHTDFMVLNLNLLSNDIHRL